MNCPKCNSVLIEVERNNIELEYCLDCNGFFLNIGEWNLIKEELNLPFKLTDIMNIPPSSIADVKEKARYCPYCNQVMEKVNIEGLILDRCINRHGVWFDKNELSEFINKQKENGIKNETISFLGENFIK